MFDQHMGLGPMRWRPASTRCAPKWAIAAVLVWALTSTSCSGPIPNPQPQNAKATTPVGGVVFVDGEPALGVQVTLNPLGGMDAANPTVSAGETDKQGEFTISTYGGGDGAPPGEYTLSFLWFDRTVIRMGGGDPPDMFKGKYAKSTEHKITVPDPPGFVDVGVIELSSM